MRTILLICLALLVGCTKTVYIPQETVRTEYQDRYLRDSIYLRDSVYVRDREQMIRIVAAMSKIENGVPAVMSDVIKGFELL